MQVLFPEHVKPFKHKQFEEQNPDKRPALVGHLRDKNITINNTGTNKNKILLACISIA